MSQILTYNLLHLHLSQHNKVLHYHNPLHPKDLLKNWTKVEKKRKLNDDIQVTKISVSNLKLISYSCKIE